MSNVQDRFIPRTWLLGSASSVNATGSLLSGAYTFGSSGNCVGIRFCAAASTTLVDVYFFVSAIAGTGGTVTVELRNYGSASTPGSTLLATASVATSAATKWYKATFASPVTLTAGTTYFLVFTSNDGTNFATMIRSAWPQPIEQQQLFNVLTSTNGFSTGSSLNFHAPVVLVFGDASTLGTPYTTQNTDTNNARERGIKLLGLDAGLTISGAVWAGGSTTVNALKIYADGTAPGASTLLNVSVDTAAAAVAAVRFPPFTLSANTVYRIVLGYSGNGNFPGFGQIQDATTYAAQLEAVGFGAQGMCHTTDDGSGGWTDSTDRFERIGLIVASQAAASGSTDIFRGSILR